MTTQKGRQPSAAQIDRAVETFKLLSDPTRLRIIWALLHGEHSVNNLAAHVRAPAPTVSQHLAKLRLARLVRTRREGNHIFYMVDDDHVRELALSAMVHGDHRRSSQGSAAAVDAPKEGKRVVRS